MDDIDSLLKNQWEMPYKFNAEYILNIIQSLYELNFDVLDE